MKANELEKHYVPLEAIYKLIKQANDEGDYRTFILPHKRVKESDIMELITNGFKIYKGYFDDRFRDVTVIEWE
jgi:hypothetical protein